MGRRKKIRYVRRNKRIHRKTAAPRKDLVRARVKANFTQEQAAKKLKIARRVYIKIEYAELTPSLALGAKMAKLFDTPIEKLFPDIFYHFSEFWDEFYRYNGYSEREIILAHKKYARYRLFHPRKRPKYAKKGWSQWFD